MKMRDMEDECERLKRKNYEIPAQHENELHKSQVEYY